MLKLKLKSLHFAIIKKNIVTDRIDKEILSLCLSLCRL
jgi:hypothetical protein